MSFLDPLITAGDNAALAADVVTLQSQVATIQSGQALKQEYQGYDVRRHVLVGELLTPSTFEAAFDAAYTAAAADATGLKSGYIFVPRGTWPITSAKLYTNLTGYKRNIGIVGEGRGVTIFDVTSALGDYVFSWEPPSKIAVPTDIGYGLMLVGFSVHGNGNAGGGVRVVHNVRARVHDVEVRDFNGVGDFENFGLYVGADSRYNATAAAGIQDQDMIVTDSSFSNNQGGICITRLVGSSPWLGIIAQQNAWINFVGDGTQLSILGYQQQGSGPAASSVWYSGLTSDSFGSASGWGQELLSGGTGATISAAVSKVTTVGGLAGLTADHQWSWLKLTASDGTGMYLVLEVVDPNTLKILKASTHGTEVGLTWALYGTRGGNKLTLQGSTYSESSKRSGFLLLKDQITASFYDLHLRDTNNCTYGVEAHGVTGNVIVRGGPGLATVLWATQCVDVQAPETSADKLLLDELTRPAVVCRGKETKLDGTGSQAPTVGVQLFNVVRSKKFYAACKELAAVERWSSRKTSTLNLSGSNVQQWDGCLNGSSLTLDNAGFYPQYSASDTDFGGAPGVAFTGSATAANVASLSGSILGTLFPSGTFTPTVFAVFHLPSGATKSYDRRINVSANSAADYMIAHLYSVAFGANFGAQYHGDEGTGQVATSPSSLLDTSARALLMGNSPRDGFWLGMDDGAKQGTLTGFRDFWTNNGNVAIAIPTVAGLAAETLHLAELVVFPHAFTESQFRDLVSLAAQDIPNITACI